MKRLEWTVRNVKITIMILSHIFEKKGSIQKD